MSHNPPIAPKGAQPNPRKPRHWTHATHYLLGLDTPLETHYNPEVYAAYDRLRNAIEKHNSATGKKAHAALRATKALARIATGARPTAPRPSSTFPTPPDEDPEQ